MKKVAIDLRILDTPSSGKRGIGYYTFNQFQELEKIGHPDLEFIYYNIYGGTRYKELNLSKESRFWNILTATRPHRGLRRLDPIFKRLWHLAVKKSNPDLIHITHQLDIIYVDIPQHIKSVVTFYDLIPLLDIEKYFGKEKARVWYRNRLSQLNHATKIIAISQSVKDDLIKHLNVPSQKIKVIYGGFDERFKVINKDQVKKLLAEKYKINSKFIMAQPAFTSHKNADRIFLSFKKFIEKNKNDYQLVVVCKLIPKEEKIWDQRLKELGIREKVVLTNFVPDHNLPHFYNGAEVLLFPSLYEGFGLPILEAMACGTPVITSNTSSMPEAGGDGTIYVDPEDVDSITAALEKVLEDEKLQKLMVKKGFAQIKKFSWEKCAKQTLDLYQEVLSSS